MCKYLKHSGTPVANYNCNHSNQRVQIPLSIYWMNRRRSRLKIQKKYYSGGLDTYTTLDRN